MSVRLRLDLVGGEEVVLAAGQSENDQPRLAVPRTDDGPLTATAILAGVVGCGFGVSASSNGQLSSSTIVVDQFSYNSR